MFSFSKYLLLAAVELEKKEIGRKNIWKETKQTKQKKGKTLVLWPNK